jgi:hypothetical protein
MKTEMIQINDCELEAIQWTGANAPEVLDFCGESATQEGAFILVKNEDGISECGIGDYLLDHDDGNVYPYRKGVGYL